MIESSLLLSKDVKNLWERLIKSIQSGKKIELIMFGMRKPP
jgi:nucleoid DNA-binding protein